MQWQQQRILSGNPGSDPSSGKYELKNLGQLDSSGPRFSNEQEWAGKQISETVLRTNRKLAFEKKLKL